MNWEHGDSGCYQNPPLGLTKKPLLSLCQDREDFSQTTGEFKDYDTLHPTQTKIHLDVYITNKHISLARTY